MNRTMTVAMIVAMVMAACAVSIAADDTVADTWDGTATTQDWYSDESVRLEIDSAADLAGLAQLVSEGNTFEGKTVTLVADIDLDDKEWTPIGTSSNPFKGTFEGSGKTISNLLINDKELDYAGLFGYLATPGTIQNVTVSNPDVSAKSNVGALVGSAYTGTVTGCKVTGDIAIEGYYKVGGLTGDGYATITDCSVIGTIGSTVTGLYLETDLEGDNVGGIIGYRAEGNLTISGCTVKQITVEGTREVGGLAGSAYDNSTITGCSVENVTVSSNADPTYIENNPKTIAIGGLVGLYAHNGDGGGTLSDCKVSNIALSSDNPGVVMNYTVGGQRGSASVEPLTDVISSNVTIEGTNSGASSISFIRDGVSYPTIDAALDNVSSDTTLYIPGGVYGMFPVSDTFTFEHKVTFQPVDGSDVTIRIVPSSGCYDDTNHTCLIDNTECNGPNPNYPGDLNTPQRIQSFNAQYQIFNGFTDVAFSGMDFVFVPSDFTLCLNNNGWEGIATASTVRNGELQFQNLGNLSFNGCNFQKVIVSPFSCKGTTTITGCSFSEVYDAYAIKDIYSENATIEDCEFTNCGGAIYFEGDSAKGALTISDNTFTNIDSVEWAAEGKAGTRGLIQLSAAGDYSNAVFNISGNSSDNDAALLRLLNDSVDVSKISLEDNSEIDGPLLTSSSNHIQIGDNYYASFEEAVEAIRDKSGDVTVIINGNLDLTKGFAESANNNIEYDLSTSRITSLTIQGSNDASILTGVDGHYIDGENGNQRCPVLNFSLPNDAALDIEDITFEDDLWIDNDSGSVTFTGCIFHGAISAYPQSVDVTFDKNRFQFNGTASNFYSGNAYPVWFKIEENTEFKFIKNIVTGPRGVHIENRSDSTTDITVTGNTFTLDDDDGFVNKTIALQLVNTMPGEIVFTNNIVDAYMAICLFSGIEFTGTIEFADNTLSEGCKEFGSNEWGSNETTADNFAASLLPARVGDVYYHSLSAAIDAASGTDNAVVLVNDITVDTWDMIWNISGVTIDGQGHTIKVNGIKSGDNHDAIFHSAGGNTFRKLIIDMSEITADSNIGGFRAISASAGDVIQNVTVIGNEHVEYGITVAGTGAEEESILVDGCVFRNCGYGVFSDYQTGLEKLTIEKCTFEGCEYATILYPEESEFIGNSVSGGKLNIMHPGQLITGNTFNDASRIKFYDTPGEFSKNKVSEDSYLDSDDDVTGPVDVSENYWGGGEPNDSQLGGASGIVSWTNYYLDEAMTQRSDDPVPEPEPGDDTPIIPPIDDDDDYIPIPPVVVDDSSSDDDTVKIVACAAAAVVAAIMAAFLILGHRRD